MAHISIRESIRWLPGEAEEPTSTIVLTSPGKKFVDLRFLLPQHADKDANPANVTDDDDVVIPLSRLVWAIAGTSRSVPTPDRGPGTTHAWWTHWIDSRTPVATATDEGDMTPLDGGRTLEVGRMVNPDTGLETDYEEIWIDPAAEAVPGDAGYQIVVLRFEGAGDTEKGSVVRLGKMCQGLLRTGDEIRAERWEWKEGGGWKRVTIVGDGTKLPCKLILDGLERNDDIEHEGRTWKVVETGRI